MPLPPLSTSCSHTTKSLLPFEYEQDVLEMQGLKEKKERYHIKRWIDDFCYDKEENCSLPLHLSFLSSERRQPVKLAIRRVIWQAAQSAFAVPLHLLNITKSCSVALVHIKKVHSWKRAQRMTDDSRWTEPCVLLGAAWLSGHCWKGLSQNPSHHLSGDHCLFFCLFCAVIAHREGFAVICHEGANLTIYWRSKWLFTHEAGYETKGQHEETTGAIWK